MPTTYEALERKCNDAAIKIRNVTDERDAATDALSSCQDTLDDKIKQLNKAVDLLNRAKLWLMGDAGAESLRTDIDLYLRLLK